MSHRLRVVEVSDVIIAGLLRHGTHAAEVVANPLPDDAQLVAVQFDGRTISLAYHSDSFAEVGDGQPVPKLAPTFRRAEGRLTQ